MRVLLGRVGGEGWCGGRCDAVPRPAETSPPAPAGPGHLAPHYDLTISLPAADTPCLAAFTRWLAGAAAAHGLRFAVLQEGVLAGAARRLGTGDLTIGYHLNYFSRWHRPDDPYERLAQAVADAGGCPVNPPARACLFTDKAAAHAELACRGLGVPDTILVRPWAPDRPLTRPERARLRLDEPGARVFIKPANGFGGRGVVRAERSDAKTLAAAFAAARHHDRRDTYLVQRAVRCPRLECDDGVERAAYWRVLYCLDELIPFWWSRAEDGSGPGYRALSREEVRAHRLRPVLAYAAALARLSGLNWFSTELCLSSGPEPSRYRVSRGRGRTWPVVAIDYVNDQCDVDVQSRWPTAPPDAVVRHVAWRFAEAAWLRRHTAETVDRALPLRRAA
jgi:hypothetical protein